MHQVLSWLLKTFSSLTSSCTNCRLLTASFIPIIVLFVFGLFCFYLFCFSFFKLVLINFTFVNNIRYRNVMLIVSLGVCLYVFFSHWFYLFIIFFVINSKKCKHIDWVVFHICKTYTFLISLESKENPMLQDITHTQLVIRCAVNLTLLCEICWILTRVIRNLLTKCRWCKMFSLHCIRRKIHEIFHLFVHRLCWCSFLFFMWLLLVLVTCLLVGIFFYFCLFIMAFIFFEVRFSFRNKMFLFNNNYNFTVHFLF